MRIVTFTHSLASCWNHGNAHFLRGVLRALIADGHAVEAYEPEGAWSLDNLLRDRGPAGLDAYRTAYPELSSRTYARAEEAVERAVGADLVVGMDIIGKAVEQHRHGCIPWTFVTVGNAQHAGLDPLQVSLGHHALPRNRSKPSTTGSLTGWPVRALS